MRRVIAVFFCFFAGGLASQNLPQTEIALARLGKKTIEAKTEEARLAAADSFALVLDDALRFKAAFSYPFDAVKNLSKLTSPDKNFRLYTWSVPLRNGSFAFFGRVTTLRGNKVSTQKLTDAGHTEEKPEFKILKPEQWFGAVYYDIVKTKHSGITYYTLLGYRPNNSSYHQKVADVVSSQNLQRLRFGEKVFNTPVLNGQKVERPPYRLILRYNPKAVVMLRWITADEHILFDHLAPPDASQFNDWKLYGPDFSYDALVWQEGMWQLKEAVSVKGDPRPAPAQQSTQQGLPPKR